MNHSYSNSYVMLNGKAYRITRDHNGRTLCVHRKTQHGETPLEPNGGLVKRLVKIDTEQLAKIKANVTP